MIIVKIIGGLGNQMFQYSVGKCLAHLNGTLLKLDVTSFDEYRLRDFDLQQLGVNPEFATEGEISALLPSHNFEKALQYLGPLKKRTVYREKHFHFDENVLKLGSNVYLKGYFQSEKYFHPVENIIRSEFMFSSDLIKRMGDFSSKIKSGNSVSVHLRRGDISADAESLAYHGLIPENYYREAFEIIKTKIKNPIFYFFSDDISWVKKNFNMPGSDYVSDLITKNHFEDLYLMSQCRHNIIANSSFSWWGAWLNNNPDKIVIAPEKWFNKGPKDTQDLLPESWIKL